MPGTRPAGGAGRVRTGRWERVHTTHTTTQRAPLSSFLFPLQSLGSGQTKLRAVYYESLANRFMILNWPKTVLLTSK